MIHLEKVTYKNEEAVIRLDIFESQYPFVADNAESLADAYVAITSDDAYAYPFAIYDDDTPHSDLWKTERWMTMRQSQC